MKDIKKLMNTPNANIFQAVGFAINRYPNDEEAQIRYVRSNFAILRPGSKIHTIDGVFTTRKYGLFEKDNQKYQYNVVFDAVKRSLESDF